MSATVTPARIVATVTQRTLQRACSERVLMAAVIECAQRLGWAVFHAEDRAPDAERGDYRQYERGFPDLILAKEGRLSMAVELKAERGKLSREQREWIRLLTLGGLTTHVFRPSDWLSGRVEELLR